MLNIALFSYAIVLNLPQRSYANSEISRSTLANFDWIDFTRVKWNTCSDDSGADCLTPKGFTFMRVIVSEGVHIDFYNLHADAGYVIISTK